MLFSQIRFAHIALAAITLTSASTSFPRQAAPDGVAITFLANEGVLLSAGGKKAIIDGLFLKYKTGFVTPAESTQSALERARPPFDADLVLVTHHHGDHFHPAPMAAHLRANRKATLLTSQQVIDSLGTRLRANELPVNRIRARTMAPGARRREVVNGITVELLGLPHGGFPRVEHLGYVVELGGRRVLHVGDTDAREASYKPFRLDTARIDVALLPTWMIGSAEGRRIIERWIKPKQVVAIHVGISEEARALREVKAALPNALVFTQSLETRRW